MSTQPTPGIDEAGTTDHPSRSDGFVRGLSEAIGGPLGDHAVAWTGRPAASAGSGRRPGSSWRWPASRSRCTGCRSRRARTAPGRTTSSTPGSATPTCSPSTTPRASTRARSPTGTTRSSTRCSPATSWARSGCRCTPIGVEHPSINQGQWFYNVNALVLGALAVATVAVILALRRRRPWDAAIFALAPALLLTATVNWDLLAIGLAAFGLLAWARRQPALAGVLLGLAGAAKLWPLFLLGPILVLGAAGPPARAAALTATGTAIAGAGAGEPAGRDARTRTTGAGSSS